MSPCSGLSLTPRISAPTAPARSGAADLAAARSPSSPAVELGDAERLVVGKPGLLQRMGERVVADVVQQRGEADRDAVVLGDAGQLAPLLQRRQGAPGQVVGAERVLEAGVGGAGIDQEGVPDLADVAQALNGRGVEGQQRRAVESDVVPRAGRG